MAKVAPEKIPGEKILGEKILGEKKIEIPAVAKATPAPTSNSATEIGPFQPSIAETLATPRAKRPPLAYALAAAAVIAVVALVVGGYWFVHQRELVADIKIDKQSQSPATVAKKPAPPMVAAKPATPAPTAPEKKIAAKPEAAPPKVAAAPKPPQTPKPDIKVAVAPPPAAKPVPPTITSPAETAKPATPKPPVVTVQKTPDKPPPVAEAKPSPPVVAATPKLAPVTLPVAAAKPTVPSAAPVVAAKPTVPSAAPPQLAMLTPPPAPPVVAPVKPAVVPVKPSKPSGNAGAVAGDEPTWRRNAIAAPPFTGQPQIAIVIDDLGLDRDRTERAVALKGPVTLSFLAYASDLPKQTEAARRAGHELIVHVPMEPIVRPKFVSQTSGGATPARAELLRRLRWDLSRFNGYVGVNNHMGNRLSADPEATQTVIGELKARGLLFLDSRVGGALSAAERQGVPTVMRDVRSTTTSPRPRSTSGSRIWRRWRAAAAPPSPSAIRTIRPWMR